MANQNIQFLELRNENNDDSPLFPNSLFTLVEEGTFNPIVIESPGNLTIIFEGISQKLGKDFDRDFMMEEFPGARTFPQIRVDGENVGGYTEFKALIDARL